LDNVIFHDPVSKLYLAGLMASTDIGMQILANIPAFYYGTSPNKFFDYLSSGLPVLNNYPGWLSGIITENHCGFAVPPENPTAFANALEAAADDREALKEMGKNSLKLAQEKFNRDILSNQWVEWLLLTQS
jgi:glycosyltransferase involved in cell wall biosynthesis